MECKTPERLKLTGILTSIKEMLTPTKKKQSKLNHTTENFMELLTKVKRKQTDKVNQINRTSTWYQWIVHQWTDGFLKPLLIWFLWLLTGTLYYGGYDFEGNYYKGFNFAVDSGYSVGWGMLKVKYRYSKIFAIFYLFVGALFVLGYLATLIKYAMAESDSTYEQLNIRRNIERTCRYKGWLGAIYVYILMNNEKLFMIYIWFIFVFIGAFITVCAVRWPWLDGFYFSISSMSTGGLEGIPLDSPNYVYILGGLFTAIGVPVMGIAVSNIGLLIAEAHAAAKVDAIVNQQTEVTRGEISDLLRIKTECGGDLLPITARSNKSNRSNASALNNNNIGIEVDSRHSESDGGVVCIDKNEFIIASLVRMRIVDVAQVHDLLKKFDRVDVNMRGTLTEADVISSRVVGGGRGVGLFGEDSKAVSESHGDSKDDSIEVEGNVDHFDMLSVSGSGRCSAVPNVSVSKAGYSYLEDV